MCSNWTVWHINMLYQYVRNNGHFWEDGAGGSKRIHLHVSTVPSLLMFPSQPSELEKTENHWNSVNEGMFYATRPFGSCIKRELKGSGNFVDAKDSFLLQPDEKFKESFPFQKASTAASHSLLKKNLLRDIDSSKVPLLLWHQKFHFKRRRTQGCPSPLCLNFSQDFSMLIWVRQDYQGFWQSWAPL